MCRDRTRLSFIVVLSGPCQGLINIEYSTPTSSNTCYISLPLYKKKKKEKDLNVIKLLAANLHIGIQI